MAPGQELAIVGHSGELGGERNVAIPSDAKRLRGCLLPPQARLDHSHRDARPVHAAHRVVILGAAEDIRRMATFRSPPLLCPTIASLLARSQAATCSWISAGGEGET